MSHLLQGNLIGKLVDLEFHTACNDVECHMGIYVVLEFSQKFSTTDNRWKTLRKKFDENICLQIVTGVSQKLLESSKLAENFGTI